MSYFPGTKRNKYPYYHYRLCVCNVQLIKVMTVLHSDQSRLMCSVFGWISDKHGQSCCFSQGSAATLFGWGGRVYSFPMWTFFRIPYTKN